MVDEQFEKAKFQVENSMTEVTEQNRHAHSDKVPTSTGSSSNEKTCSPGTSVVWEYFGIFCVAHQPHLPYLVN